MDNFTKRRKTKRLKNQLIIALLFAVVIGSIFGFLSPRGLSELAGANNVTGECNIKGNISSTGVRIYHVPSGEYYSVTQINPARGEKWFCSEKEARQAGWRRSKV